MKVIRRHDCNVYLFTDRDESVRYWHDNGFSNRNNTFHAVELPNLIKPFEGYGLSLPEDISAVIFEFFEVFPSFKDTIHEMALSGECRHNPVPNSDLFLFLDLYSSTCQTF